MGFDLYFHVDDLARGGVDFDVQHPELVFRVFSPQMWIDNDQPVVFLNRQVQDGLKKRPQYIQARRFAEKQLENKIIFWG
jgi:hypothetical protein